MAHIALVLSPPGRSHLSLVGSLQNLVCVPRVGRGGSEEFGGHLVLSHHMANCEAASRKRVLFQLKRGTESLADPGNVCSEPTR